MIKNSIFLIFLILVGCVQEEVPMSELEFAEETNANLINNKSDQNNFEKTLYQITSNKCIGCHTSQSPRHAHPDVQTALNELIRYGKVDLSEPSNSRVYLKVKNESHGCWSDCPENAEEILASIKSWIELGVDQESIADIPPADEEEQKICVPSISENIVDCSNEIENSKIAIQQEICSSDGLSFEKIGVCSIQECNENYEIVEESCVEISNDPVSTLVFSKNSLRTNPQDINGKILSGDNYLFFQTEIENIAKVEFLINGVLENSDSAIPFDLKGSNPDGSALPLDSTNFDNGNVTLLVKVYRQNEALPIEFNYEFSINNVVVDKTKPVVTLLNPSINNEGKVFTAEQVINIGFSEVISGFDKTDFVVSGANILSLLKISDLEYKLNIELTQPGNISISLPEGALSDIYGNINSLTSTTFVFEKIVYDGVAIYNAKCMSCHQEISKENLVNRTAGQIQTAIATVGDMITSKKNLYLLSLEEIKAVALALKSEDKLELSCDQTVPVYTDMRRLTDYEIKNAYKDIFGSEILTNEDMKKALNLLEVDRSGPGFQSRSITASQTEAIINLAYVVGQTVSNSKNYKQEFFGTCSNESIISDACLNSMFNGFFKLIYRRSLKASEKTDYQNLLLEVSRSPKDFLAMAIGKALSSPLFVFVNTFEGALVGNEITLTSQEIATKLALTYWGSVPTLDLINYSESNDLKNQSLLESKAAEMIVNDKSKNHFTRFVTHWINKERKSVNYPTGFAPTELDMDTFDKNIEEELHLYLNHIVWEQNGSFIDLFSSKSMFIHNSQMALIFEQPEPGTPNGFIVSTTERAGLFSRPYFLHRSGKASNDIIHRGLDIKQNFLCEMIGDPNEVVSSDQINAPVDVDIYEVTTREYIHTQTFSKDACMLCHSQFNGFGYALENYDDLGRQRIEENIYDVNGEFHKAIAISTSGEIAIAGENFSFNNDQDIQNKIGSMNRAKQCMAKKWFQFTEHLKPAEENSCQVNSIVSGFEVKDNKGGKIKDVLTGFISNKYFKKKLIK